MELNTLHETGELIKTVCDGTVQLWVCEGEEYVVLSDNTIITRQEDNEIGEPFFPYNK
jgi:hypothetical protein